MTVEVVPFEAGCGAEIRGVDIREPLAPADRDRIRAAWLQHLVLRFREQPMSDAEHMAFTRQFGELEFNPAKLIEKQYGVETQTAGRKSEIPPEISVISNIIEDGKAIGGLGDGEAFWHTDSSFVDVPPAASLLRSLEVPPQSAGGCLAPMRFGLLSGIFRGGPICPAFDTGHGFGGSSRHQTSCPLRRSLTPS